MNIYIYLSNSIQRNATCTNVLYVCIQRYIFHHLSMFKSPTNKPVDLSIDLAILSTSTRKLPHLEVLQFGLVISLEIEGRSPRNHSKSVCKWWVLWFQEPFLSNLIERQLYSRYSITNHIRDLLDRPKRWSCRSWEASGMMLVSILSMRTLWIALECHWICY